MHVFINLVHVWFFTGNSKEAVNSMAFGVFVLCSFSKKVHLVFQP